MLHSPSQVLLAIEIRPDRSRRGHTGSHTEKVLIFLKILKISKIVEKSFFEKFSGTCSEVDFSILKFFCTFLTHLGKVQHTEHIVCQK